MSMNITDNVVPVLYDSDGNEIDTTKLKLSNTTVTISAEILGTKTVDLVFSTSGTPGEGATVESVTSDPESVTIKGAASALNSVTSIEVPASAIDVTNALEDVSTTVDITEYLPDGVSLVDSKQASVKVTVAISAESTRKLEISADNISMSGLGSDYTVKLDSQTVEVIVTGDMKAVQSIDASQITGKADLSGLTEGTHTVAVDLSLDKDTYMYDTVNVSVTITKKDDSSGTNSGAAGAADSAISSGTAGSSTTGSSEAGDNNSNNNSETTTGQ